MNEALAKLKGKLIVSCQAEGASPFNSPEGVTMFALSAKMGGAGGIRSEGIEKTKKLVSCIDLPVIGLIKNYFPDGFVRITRTFLEVESLLNLNVGIIAIDGTQRKVDKMTGPEFINQCKKKYPSICILADTSQFSEAAACITNGADCVSSTLRGYTPETINKSTQDIDLEFIKELCFAIKNVPIIAEGKINTPDLARQIAELGVWSIVVGTAITRPHIITEWFVNSINNI